MKTSDSASWHEMAPLHTNIMWSIVSAQWPHPVMSPSVNCGYEPLPVLSFEPFGGDTPVDHQLKECLWTSLHPDS